MFAQFDLCMFIGLVVPIALLGAIYALWELFKMKNFPEIYIQEKLMEERERARKQRMAAGIGVSLLRIFFGGR